MSELHLFNADNVSTGFLLQEVQKKVEWSSKFFYSDTKLVLTHCPDEMKEKV